MSLKIVPVAPVPHCRSNFHVVIERSIDGRPDEQFKQKHYTVAIYHPTNYINILTERPGSPEYVKKLFEEFFASINAAMMGMVYYRMENPTRSPEKARVEYENYLAKHKVDYRVTHLTELAPDAVCQYVVTVQ